MNYSIAEENYIKHIYHLQQIHQTVTTNVLAEEIQSKPASVTDMLKKLQLKKLLDYEPYHGFTLNAAGNKIALHIIRRHRLWEYFLAMKLGFEWDKVHAIAEELEHVGGTELINKLDVYLNYPQTDPHGDPIPDSNGKMPVIKQQSIAQTAIQSTVIVSSVSKQSAEMLELLKHCHINIGSKITISKKFEFDGSVEIKVPKKGACLLSSQAANHIFVYYDQN